jgi:hypothetical protein
MSERVRTPDFQILHLTVTPSPLCRCADGGGAADIQAADLECNYCGSAFGFDIPIYRDPLRDGELTAHLSCVIEHGEVRVWTPEHFAVSWPTVGHEIAESEFHHAARTRFERSLKRLNDLVRVSAPSVIEDGEGQDAS